MPVGWEERKEQFLKFAKRPLLRSIVFRELFEECNSTNYEVTDFINEFIVQIFPKNFLDGCSQNKKAFRKKIK